MINFNHTLREQPLLFPHNLPKLQVEVHTNHNAGLDELLLRAQAEVADIDFFDKIPPKEETAHFASYIQSSGLWTECIIKIR